VNPIRTLLLAVDFSDASSAAVDVAVEFAKQFSATLHVVHAFDLPIPLVTPYEVAIPEAYLDQTRKAAAQKLAAVVETVAGQGVTVESHLAEAPAAPAIVRAAEEVGADLVVMGTHGHTGIKHFVLGSVAERTLRLAPCSVLAVKPGRD
jgi:nucleotide-binding universal stress UspA family protein